MSRPELPQQVIDEALCIGANDRNSRLIICAYFMKDHTPEENAAFLAKHYGTNGAGFYINDREYALWYDPEGILGQTGGICPVTQCAKSLCYASVLGRCRQAYPGIAGSGAVYAAA